MALLERGRHLAGRHPRCPTRRQEANEGEPGLLMSQDGKTGRSVLRFHSYGIVEISDSLVTRRVNTKSLAGSYSGDQLRGALSGTVGIALAYVGNFSAAQSSAHAAAMLIADLI
jgi:hypothetical protein